MGMTRIELTEQAMAELQGIMHVMLAPIVSVEGCLHGRHLRAFVVGQQGLALQRHRGRRKRQRKPVSAVADLQGQRHRCVSLPARLVHRAAKREDCRRLRGAAALAYRATGAMTPHQAG